LKYLQFLAEKYFTHASKYREFPSLQLLVSIIRSDLKATPDLILRDQIIEYLQRMKSEPHPEDLPYVKERCSDFCKKRAMMEAFESCLDLMVTEKYETIVEVIRKAVSVGTVSSLGHDLIEDVEARFVASKRDCIPTGIPQLDRQEILNGGLGGGELGIIVGSAGGGKSHWLVDRGAHALKLKKNVLHYTFELSAESTGIRYDSHLVDIDSNDVFSSKDDILKYYKEHACDLGRLKIKEYPMNTASVQTLRAHIDKCTMHGFRPDLLIIDYADIMRSSRQFDSLRHELKLIYEELRTLGQSLKIPIWSASQSNKEGALSDVIDGTNMSEAYAKAAVADVIITVSRKPLEKSSGRGRLFVAKNRAGRDGILYPIKINTARSKFEIAGEQVTEESVKNEDEAQYKKSLKKKWEELQKDNSFKLTSHSDSSKNGT
jgi:replicative DNA helicase